MFFDNPRRAFHQPAAHGVDMNLQIQTLLKLLQRNQVSAFFGNRPFNPVTLQRPILSQHFFRQSSVNMKAPSFKCIIQKFHL